MLNTTGRLDLNAKRPGITIHTQSLGGRRPPKPIPSLLCSVTPLINYPTQPRKNDAQRNSTDPKKILYRSSSLSGSGDTPLDAKPELYKSTKTPVSKTDCDLITPSQAEDDKKDAYTLTVKSLPDSETLQNGMYFEHVSYVNVSVYSRMCFLSDQLDSKARAKIVKKRNDELNILPCPSIVRNHSLDTIMVNINGKPCLVAPTLNNVGVDEIVLCPLHKNMFPPSQTIEVKPAQESLNKVGCVHVEISLPEGAPPVVIEERALQDGIQHMFAIPRTPISPNTPYVANLTVSWEALAPQRSYSTEACTTTRSLVFTFRCNPGDNSDTESEKPFIISPCSSRFISIKKNQNKKIKIISTPFYSLNRVKINARDSGMNNILLIPDIFFCPIARKDSEPLLVELDDGIYYFASGYQENAVNIKKPKKGNEANDEEISYEENLLTASVTYPYQGVSSITSITPVNYRSLPEATSITILVQRVSERNTKSWVLSDIKKMASECLKTVPLVEGRKFVITNQSADCFSGMQGKILSISGDSAKNDEGKVLPFRFNTHTKLNLQINDKTIITVPLYQNPDAWFDGVCSQMGAVKGAVEQIRDCLIAPWLNFKHGKLPLLPSLPRGAILYGKPGTGKTQLSELLVAQWELAGILKRENLQKIESSQLMKSEKDRLHLKVEELFNPAAEDHRKNGPNADLHVIILDEAELVLKAKLNSSATTETNSMVNSFLTNLDGNNRIPNLLFLCTTNYLDIMEPSVYRAGRLSVLIPMPLLNATEALEVLHKRLEKLKSTGWDIDNIRPEAIAPQLANKTGAEITLTMSKALTYAAADDLFDENTKKIEQKHLVMALKDHQISAQLRRQAYDAMPASRLSYHLTKAQQLALAQIAQRTRILKSRDTSLVLYLHGKPGTGKSLISRELIDTMSDIDFYGAVTYKKNVNMANSALELLTQSTKHKMSLVCIDGLEKLLKYENDPLNASWKDVTEIWRQVADQHYKSCLLLITTQLDKEEVQRKDLPWQGAACHVNLEADCTQDDMDKILRCSYQVTDESLRKTIIRDLAGKCDSIALFQQKVNLCLNQEDHTWDSELLEDMTFFTPSQTEHERAVRKACYT